MVKQKRKNFCPKCGKPIMAGDHFCSNCGNKISSKKIATKRNHNLKWAAGAVVVAAILITGIVSGVNSNKQRNVNRAHNAAQIASIISAFDCSCGQCEKTLKECDCPTAKETHRYISKAVNKEKYSRKEIIKMVMQRYGSLRRDSYAKGG